jgi:hypothetical protein
MVKKRNGRNPKMKSTIPMTNNVVVPCKWRNLNRVEMAMTTPLENPNQNFNFSVRAR